MRLDVETLSKVQHSGMLAIRPSALDAGISLSAEEPDEEPPVDESPVGKVAVVRVLGPLAQRGGIYDCAFVDGYDLIATRFQRALATKPDAILQIIDSPGGDVAGCFEGVHQIREMVGDVPVVTWCEEQAASAGYALATIGNEVCVPASGEVGSIGVVCVHLDATARMTQEGFKATILRSRKHKYEGSSLEPLSADTRERWQARLDELDAQFVQLVTERRPQARKAIDQLAGEVASGEKAVALGLADRVCTRAEAFGRAAELGAQRKAKRKMDEKERERIAALEARATAAEAERNQLIEATGAATFAVALGRVLAGKAASDKLAEVEAANARLEAEASARQVATAITAALEEGKVQGRVTPGNRERLTAFGVKYGVEDLKAHIAELPVHAATTNRTDPPEGSPGHALSAEDRAVARMLGLSDKDYAAAQAAEEKAQ